MGVIFTGIIEELGTIVSKKFLGQESYLEIQGSTVLEDINKGDSIAVNGVCLTASHLAKNNFRADVMPETMRQTNLHLLLPGDKVNLERALTPHTRMGGHFVSGHVDGVGKIISKKHEGNAIIIYIESPEEVLTHTVKKGSIAVDGISLTVVDKTDGHFSVSIIPHTAAATTLNYKKEGHLVNLEADMLARYVANFLRQQSKDLNKSLSMGYLEEKGFI